MYRKHSNTSRFLLAALATGFVTAAPAWGQVLNEDLKILAEDVDGQNSGDFFGQAIDLDNGILVVGAHFDDFNFSEDGSAYIFNLNTGVQMFQISRSTPTAQSLQFGISIAIDNNIVVVGENDMGNAMGAAYLFNAQTGMQLAQLVPNDGNENDDFGLWVAIDNGVVAVGARGGDGNEMGSGAVYLFNAATGIQSMKLIASDGMDGDGFGQSVAMSNGVVAVGADGDGDNGSTSGSVYLFDVSTGDLLVKLLPDDGASGDQFGRRVAIDNGIVAAGAWGDDDNGSASGSAYLFDVSTGDQLFKLLPDDGALFDGFGSSVSISGGVVAVGTEGVNVFTGSAYLFDASTGTQIAKLLASDGDVDDAFGISIVIDNGIVAVGAQGADGIGNFNDDTGAAYIFTVPGCPADLTGDGLLDINDVLAFLDAFNAADPIGDFNGDGSFDIFDVLAFLDVFNAGCP